MSKQKMRFFLSFVCFFLSSSVLLAQQFKLDRCFPDSTQIYFSIDNVKELGDHWNATQLPSPLRNSKNSATLCVSRSKRRGRIVSG